MRKGMKPDVVDVTAETAADDVLVINGSAGEGGGQMLRSSLSLSMITGRPVRIVKIRAGRKRGGLLRQHLTCVKAAAEICGADVTGGSMGSTEIEFVPGEISSGQWRFAVGTAGSSGLVFQTVLPALLMGKDESTLTLEGGTHNPMAPPWHYLRDVFAPALARFGPVLSLELDRAGFYPAGGGRWSAVVQPVAELKSVDFVERGKSLGRRFEVLLAGLPAHVAERELLTGAKLLSWPKQDFVKTVLPSDQGPGNVVMAMAAFENVSEMTVAFGEIGKKAEHVAKQAARGLQRYLARDVVVGEYLADQLLLPMALAGGGELSTVAPSLHSWTQMAVIEAFLPVHFTVVDGGESWRIRVDKG